MVWNGCAICGAPVKKTKSWLWNLNALNTGKKWMQTEQLVGIRLTTASTGSPV